jgi:PhzF family phenazine biosynthesis protein
MLLDAPRDAEWMQRVAMEMNQAETAFLVPQADGFGLRWFTPMAEVDLCGHATLASAHYLWESGVLERDRSARFSTRSGWLTARPERDGGVTIDLPAITSRPVAAPSGLIEALGVTPREVLRGDFDYLCVLDDAAAVRNTAPDFVRLGKIQTRGVLVTARGDKAGVDFISRCFFPDLGIPEDPVTGSAHCAFATYWRDVLGRDEMVGYQASARGGTLRCKVTGDRVELTGRAVTTLRGDFLA